MQARSWTTIRAAQASRLPGLKPRRPLLSLVQPSILRCTRTLSAIAQAGAGSTLSNTWSPRTPRAVIRAPSAAAATSGAPGFEEPARPQSPEVVQPKVFSRLSFQDVYYYINCIYWSLLLVSVLTGNNLLSRVTHFEYYTTAMFCSSFGFMAYHGVRWLVDAGKHLKKQVEFDISQFLRYAWNAAFWAGFVLWYAAPPMAGITEWTGTPGSIMALFGLALAGSAAMTEGLWSFMGAPQVPQSLTTSGPYAICRHPQAMGNMLFLIGFSLAGGAVAASAAFLVSWLLYHSTVVPREEEMLLKAFGQQYEVYRQRTPSYAYALLLLTLLEVLLIWRLYPYSATPIGPTQGNPGGML